MHKSRTPENKGEGSSLGDYVPYAVSIIIAQVLSGLEKAVTWKADPSDKWKLRWIEKDCYCMKTMGKLNWLLIFFSCPCSWVWMPECSGISGILLSFKYLHSDLSLWRNVPPTMCKDFHQMRCFKGISVKMNGSAQFRNQGERGRWNIHLALPFIVKRSISLKRLSRWSTLSNTA